MRQIVRGLGTSVGVNRECWASRPPGRGAVRGLRGVRVRGGVGVVLAYLPPLTCPILLTERLVTMTGSTLSGRWRRGSGCGQIKSASYSPTR